ncbi:TIGR02530 family flagellar biosynthesis protein [Geothermobacter hydrogeniphilus]|uniref:Flagellar operon protein n=1 Tax=Geothermobacter hydrogeniphilus TaxID=1969733 RepID=A0A1X0YED1_9BACT|nr:TIGR02530 family flagellar biosynthesis protein [Geothermobacter hydrogeniphilus]ORJ63518.1 hypothetical protein B5V00_01235 [Geothermobacter hydrogeniphilus]
MSSPITIMPTPIGRPTSRPTTGTGRNSEVSDTRFESLLQDRMAGQNVRFSRHADQRLQQRGLRISGEQSQRLQQAMRKVADKGGRDSLVLLDNLALVVSVPNNTVVTVSDRGSLRENVFTNIDSAVIA